MAAWFGLLVGLLEVGILAIQQLGFHKIVKVPRDYVWMTPLAELLLYLLIGSVFALLSLRWPRLASRRAAAFVYALLGLLALFLFYPKLHVVAVLLLAAGGAVQAARWIARHPIAFDRLVRRTLPAMAGLVLVLGIGLRGGLWLNERLLLAKLPPARPEAPNVLLIVLDTVRAQSLSTYGYERPTSPQLERLARMGVRFDYALSTAPWTLPSHGTMFTGRWPHELSGDWGSPLDDTYPTLAEVFNAHGYRTAGFVANAGWVGYEHGLNRGFAHYEDYPITPLQMLSSTFLMRLTRLTEREAVLGARSAEKKSTPEKRPATQSAHKALQDKHKGKILRPFLNNYGPVRKKIAPAVNGQFLDWLDPDDQRPFFVFLNYMEAHDPYTPRPPFDTQFGPTKTHPKLTLSGLVKSIVTPEEERQLLVNAYDGALATLDRDLGLLLDELRARDELENTLVVVTSDHGEQLGEHGLIFHANSLYIQLLHVPLVISYPGHVPAGVSVPEYVSLYDLAVTMLDLAGIHDELRFPGSSLTRFWETPGLPPSPGDALLIAEVSKGVRTPAWWPVSKGNMKSVVSDPLHYIRNGDGIEELYDLRADPFEERDIAGSPEGQTSLERLRLKLETALARAGTPR